MSRLVRLGVGFKRLYVWTGLTIITANRSSGHTCGYFLMVLWRQMRKSKTSPSVIVVTKTGIFQPNHDFFSKPLTDRRLCLNLNRAEK